MNAAPLGNPALSYSTLGSIAVSNQPNMKVELFVVGMTVGLTLLVGFSRCYLGIHWSANVLDGWGVGSIWDIFWWKPSHSYLPGNEIEQSSPETA